MELNLVRACYWISNNNVCHDGFKRIVFKLKPVSSDYMLVQYVGDSSGSKKTHSGKSRSVSLKNNTRTSPIVPFHIEEMPENEEVIHLQRKSI